MAKFLGNLGAVAKGVGEFLASGAEDDNDGGVEALLERISDGVLAEDRRSAMNELRIAVAESAQAQFALGAIGLPVLTTCLKEEREDVEMLRGALETLYNAMSTELSTGSEGEQANGVSACKVNAELFARDQSNVDLLLGLLEEDDFYVRYHTVQLMTELVVKAPHGGVQEAILGSPCGVARLMDMMAEREVIRNEALLLLSSLTKTNEELKKIVVFEGAFDRLFAILRDEGAVEGGIVVQDCLELMTNLLRASPSNQTFFRESSFLPQIPAVLKLRVGAAPEALPAQKAANLGCALEMTRLLLCKGTTADAKESDRLANQTILAKAELLPALLPLALPPAAGLPMVIREKALLCIAELMDRHPNNQAAFGSTTAEGAAGPTPALNQVLLTALYSNEQRLCNAAEHVFSCYCSTNPDGQVLLASTIMPIGGVAAADEQHLTFGNILVRALLDPLSSPAGQAAAAKDTALHVTCHAATVLRHVLYNNPQCKERVLTIPLEVSSVRGTTQAAPEVLLPCIMRHLATARQQSKDDSWLQGSILRLLITWLHACPPAVEAYLKAPLHLPALVEMLTEPPSPHVAGLAAVLFGICLVCNETVGDSDAATVLDILVTRVGLNNLFTHWDAMEATSEFGTAAMPPKPSAPVSRIDSRSAPEADVAGTEEHRDPDLYDHQFATWVIAFKQELNKCIVTTYARPKQVAPAGGGVWECGAEGEEETEKGRLERAHALIRAQELEMAEMRARTAQLAERLLHMRALGGADQPAGPDPLMQEAAAALSLNDNKVVGLEREIVALKAKVAMGAEGARGQVEEARAAQSAAEEEVKALSQAYNTLEADIYKKEEEERKLRADLAQALQQATQASAAAAVPAAPAGASQADLDAARAEGVAEGRAQVEAEMEDKLESVREEGRAEAASEAEGEMNDLLVCLGQEESKTEKLRNVLEDLGHDVDELLDGIGEQNEDEDEEDEDEEEGDGEDPAEEME